MNINSKFIVEKLVIHFYFFAHIILLLYMLFSNKLAGDFYGLNVNIDINRLEMLILFALVFISYVSIYIIYKHTVNTPVKLNFRLSINKKKFDIFYFLLLIIQNIFVYSTGVGRVFSESTNRLSPIFALLNVDCLIGIYYIVCRRKGKLYVLNIILYIANNILRGWTGVILVIFFLELYSRYQKGMLQTILKKIWFLIPPFLFIGGGFLYKLFYPIKIYIRLHYFESIPFYEAIVKLVNRISFFSSNVLAIQNNQVINELYWEQGIHLLELKTMFRSLLPRFFMPFKEFRIFANLVEKSLYPDISNSVSTEVGITSYIYNIFTTNLGEFIIWILGLIIGSLIIRIFYLLYEEKKGQLSFLWFLYLIDIVKVGSLSLLSTYYLYLLYMTPILLLLGVIKIKKKTRNGFL